MGASDWLSIPPVLRVAVRLELAPGGQHGFDRRDGDRGLVLHAARLGQHAVAPVARQADRRPAGIVAQVLGMDVQPADPGGLLADEAVAAQRRGGRVVLAAGERLRIEGVGGGADQFFLCVSSGESRRNANVASGTR